MYSVQNSTTNNISPEVTAKSRTANRSLAKIGLSLLSLIAFSLPTTSALAFTAVPPVRRADEFIDSIGMRTEFWFIGYNPQSPYNTNYAGIKSALLDLRVRHIREGASCAFQAWPTILSRMTDLSNSGIKSSSLFSPASVPPGVPTSNLNEITTAYQNCFNQVKDVVDQVEGLNEPDGSTTATIFGYTFPNNVLITQKALWNVVKKSPAPYNRIPVLAPSLLGPYFREAGAIPNAYQLRGIGQYADFNNLHTYFSSNFPEIVSPNFNPYDTSTYNGTFASLDNYLHLANLTASTPKKKIYLPAISTEAGFRTGPGDFTESVQAKYIPRVLFNNFNRGLKRTYLHELITTNPSDPVDDWGLLRFDFSPKPAFIMLKNINDFLYDPGINAKKFALGRFSYTIESSPNPFTPDPSRTAYFINNFKFVKSTFLQKSNGKYYIVLWNARSNWNSGTEVKNYPVWIRLKFTKNVTFREFDPSTCRFIKRATRNFLGAYIEDYPKIIEIDNPGI